MNQKRLLELREIAAQFLAREAMLLDEGRFDEWFAMLDDALDYVVPTRVASQTRDQEIVTAGYRIRDTKTMIKTRIARLKTGAAYAESPPSRTVRSVSSVCVLGERDGMLEVSSALVVFRQRGIDAVGDLIPARRTDRLRLTDNSPLLVYRNIILAETVLTTPNLGIFL